jgi:hypothetical protein
LPASTFCFSGLDFFVFRILALTLAAELALPPRTTPAPERRPHHDFLEEVVAEDITVSLSS